MTRFLFFDLLRIASVGAVVVYHVIMNGVQRLPYWYSLVPSAFIPYLEMSVRSFWGPFNYSLGPIAVYVLIFVSGAVLSLTHPRIGTLGEYGDFVGKRLWRIYPAFWIVLALTSIFAMVTLSRAKPIDIILTFSGMSAFFGKWSGIFEGPFWFIGTIIALYLLYPLISRAIRASPHIAILGFAVINLAAVLAIIAAGVQVSETIRWFPLSNILPFALGVYIVHLGWYPRTASGGVVLLLADMSFYAFLLHGVVPVYNLILDPVIFLAVTVVMSWWLMTIDKMIQKRLVVFFGKTDPHQDEGRPAESHT